MWFILKIFKYVDESLISTCKLCWPDLECSNQRWKLQDVAGNRWASLKTLLIEEVHMKIHTSLEISFHWEKKKKNLHNSFCKDLQTSLGLIVHNSSFLLFQFGVLNNMGGGGRGWWGRANKNTNPETSLFCNSFEVERLHVIGSIGSYISWALCPCLIWMLWAGGTGAVAWMWITKRQKHLKKLYFHYILIIFFFFFFVNNR